MKNKFELAIVIVNFNVKELLVNCLKSIYTNKEANKEWQIIVVDNNSSDDSVKFIKQNFPDIKILESKINLGFSAGNNLATPFIKSDFVLFLNPDTLIHGNAIQKCISVMKRDSQIGAITCRVDLPNGSLDYSCHRGFPSPWNAFCYFSGLSKLFPKNKVLSGYSATYMNLRKLHEVECISGTFFLTRKSVAEEVEWWDEDYFWNGEDIEFCFRIRQKGWKIMFNPDGKITHYKSSSSGLWSTSKTKVPLEVKIRSAKSSIKAMRVFYDKHYQKGKPWIYKAIISLSLELLERARIFKLKYGLKYE